LISYINNVKKTKGGHFMNYRELLNLAKNYPNPFSLNQPKNNYNTYSFRVKTQDVVKKEEEEVIVKQTEVTPPKAEAKKAPEKMITKIHRNV